MQQKSWTSKRARAIGRRAGLLATAILVCVGCVQAASAYASMGQPAVVPAVGSGAFPVAFSTTAGASRLGLAGAEVKCAGETGSGEFTNGREGKLTIKLTGCVLGGKQCSNAGEGEIELKPLKSLLAYTYPAKSGSEGRETGLVLSAASGETIAEYSCTFLKLSVAVRGSVMASVTPLGTLAKALTLSITQLSGHQGITKYESESGEAIGVKLEGKINAGIFKEMTAEGLVATTTLTGEEARVEQAPVAVTGAVTGVSGTAATLHAEVDPEAPQGPSHYFFEYGPTTSYGSISSSGELGGRSYYQVSKTISGLTAGTTYHYRVVAENQVGVVTFGADRSVTAGIPTLQPAKGVGAFPAAFTFAAESTQLALAGAETTCTGTTGTGEFTSVKDGKLTIKLTGCKVGGKQCGNVKEGEIELKLKSLLAYTYPALSVEGGRQTGLVLSPASGEMLAEYSCTFLNLKVKLKGAFIAKIAPLGQLTKTLVTAIGTESEFGGQEPGEYETEGGTVVAAKPTGAIGNGAFKAMVVKVAEPPTPAFTLTSEEARIEV